MAATQISSQKDTGEKQVSIPKPTTSAEPKLRKAHHHKVRTGCYTCRKRRVKCDETKPLCQTCTKNGHTCCGYAQLDPVRLRIVPPPSGLRGRDEHQAFQFFMETTMTWFNFKTGPCVTKCHIDEFWNPVVLQMTEAEPAIKHILLAWAELHRRILYEQLSPNEPFENDFFWQNHCQALRLLGSKSEVDIGVILIACILFCILENFRGRQEVFLSHLKSGLRILSDYDRKAMSKEPSLSDRLVTRHIRPIFKAFHVNLDDIIEFQVLTPREKMCDRLEKMKQAGRVVKTWD